MVAYITICKRDVPVSAELAVYSTLGTYHESRNTADSATIPNEGQGWADRNIAAVHLFAGWSLRNRLVGSFRIVRSKLCFYQVSVIFAFMGWDFDSFWYVFAQNKGCISACNCLMHYIICFYARSCQNNYYKTNESLKIL